MFFNKYDIIISFIEKRSLTIHKSYKIVETDFN
jgi:hypothetical protein